MSWSFKDGIPIYQQIIQILQVGIAKGIYPPGSKMPAVRDLAMEAGVNPNTMQRALAELEREGLLYSVRTSGRFVTENEDRLADLRSLMAGSYIEELLEKMYRLGYSDEQIAEAVNTAIQKHSGSGEGSKNDQI